MPFIEVQNYKFSLIWQKILVSFHFCKTIFNNRMHFSQRLKRSPMRAFDTRLRIIGASTWQSDNFGDIFVNLHIL